MCNLYRLDARDWATKFAQDAESLRDIESLFNLMDTYEMYPDLAGPINLGTLRSSGAEVELRLDMGRAIGSGFDCACLTARFADRASDLHLNNQPCSSNTRAA